MRRKAVKMTETEYVKCTDEYNGYCRRCDNVTNFGGVEPDAHGYKCDECGKRTVMGVEEALALWFIHLI